MEPILSLLYVHEAVTWEGTVMHRQARLPTSDESDETVKETRMAKGL